MLAARLIDKLLGLISTVVLARVLLPADFGLVAIAVAVVAFLTVLTDFSFDSALIQHPAPQREHFDTVWTLSVLFGLAVTVSLLAVAYPVSVFYEDDRLVGILCASALTVLVRSATNVGVVEFRRGMDFRKEFLLTFYRRLVSLPITVGLALWLRNYWALVLGGLLSTLAGVVISYSMHPFRPRISMRHRGELLGFSKWLFVNSLIAFVYTRVGHVIVGKMRGAHELGLFSIAHELAGLTTAELVAPINRAAYPGYCRLAGDKAALNRTFLQVVGLITLIAVPVAGGIALTAPIIVPLLLGEKWNAAVPLLVLLSLSGGVLSIWTSTTYVLLASGEPRKATLLAGMQSGAAVILLVAFLALDIRHGIGWAMLSSSVVMALPNLYYWKYELHIGLRIALASIWRPLVGSLAMAACVLPLQSALASYGVVAIGFLSLGLSITAGVATYCAAVLILWYLCGRPSGPETTVLGKILLLARRS